MIKRLFREVRYTFSRANIVAIWLWLIDELGVALRYPRYLVATFRRKAREKPELEKEPNLRRTALPGVVSHDEIEDVLDLYVGKPVLSKEDKERKRELDQAFIDLREISRELYDLGSRRDRCCDVIWKHGFVPQDFGYDYSPRPKGMDPYFLPEILWRIPSHAHYQDDGKNRHLLPPEGFKERGV